jgi:hypothetical protein
MEQLLMHVSPLVFIMNRNQFFVDEQPVDPRTNVKRIVDLFKAAELQSISFDRGATKNELALFCALFAGLSVASKAEELIHALRTKGVQHIRVNHVIYKKVTTDDEVVSREALKKVSPFGNADDPEARKKFMDTLLESVLSDELAHTLDIKSLLQNPSEFSRRMVAVDLAGSRELAGEGGSAGPGGGLGPGAGGGSVPGAGGGSGTGARGGSGEPLGVIGGSPGGTGGAAPNTASMVDASPEVTSQSPSTGSGTDGVAGGGRGLLLIHQLNRIQEEVEKHLLGKGEKDLSQLAQAVLEMKRSLLESIQSQRALGAAYANEEAILARADHLTDEVLLALIREEYRAGNATAQRLALLIRRLVPAPQDLRRLLPQIKKALLEEGLPLGGYLQLIRELQNELEGEELARVLQEGSETLGLDGDSLIEEIKRNPSQAAELIYLASEIQKGGGDEVMLADILVDYVERLGSKTALDQSTSGTSPDAEHVKKVLGEVESTILKQLSKMNVKGETLARMEERLNERMEGILDRMRLEWLNAQSARSADQDRQTLSLLQTLEQSAAADPDLSAALAAVRSKVDAGEIGENDFSQILVEIERQRQIQKGMSEDQPLPEDVLSSDEIMFILEKEIARANRSKTPFSALAFSFVTAKSKMKALQELITTDAVIAAALEKLTQIFRNMDYVGLIGKNKMLAILPLADQIKARKALNRVMQALHADPLEVNEVPVNIRVAGVAVTYDCDRAVDAASFTRHISTQLMDMVARLKNIQVLF